MTWLDPVRILGLIGVLFFLATALIWYERRLLALLQNRAGPNRVGPWGLLQAPADVIKLFFKEDWVPPFADRAVFVVAPTIVVVTVLMAFATIPFAPGWQVSDMNVGILYVLGMLSLGVYSVALGGWASNNKYSLVGSIRAAAQMISYEIPLGLSLVAVVLLSGSLRLVDVVEAQSGLWFVFTQPLGCAVFFVAAMAELRRTPFDLPEAESELTAGYHVEYSSMKFALFFLGEYLDLMLISALLVVLYFGGWHGPFLPGPHWFALKMAFFVTLFIVIRGSLPRYRFDQLMSIGWKVLLPLSLLNLVVTAIVAAAIR